MSKNGDLYIHQIWCCFHPFHRHQHILSLTFTPSLRTHLQPRPPPSPSRYQLFEIIFFELFPPDQEHLFYMFRLFFSRVTFEDLFVPNEE
jgi:hypothetical protein